MDYNQQPVDRKTLEKWQKMFSNQPSNVDGLIDEQNACDEMKKMSHVW